MTFSLQVQLEKAGANKENVLHQFDDLKFSFQDISYGDMKSNDFWGMLYKENMLKYKDLLLAVELILCMPFSTSVSKEDSVLFDTISLIG